MFRGIVASYNGPETIISFVNNFFPSDALQILCDIDLYLRKQPSLVDVTIPDDAKFTICGDIHGQFYDLMNIFKINGLPSETNPYLFNGDFVDRGSFSVECIFTLFGFKLLYPDHFFLARGNHESINMNQIYGFTGEVLAKYTSTMSNMFTQVYNWLPLCHCEFEFEFCSLHILSFSPSRPSFKQALIVVFLWCTVDYFRKKPSC